MVVERKSKQLNRIASLLSKFEVFLKSLRCFGIELTITPKYLHLLYFVSVMFYDMILQSVRQTELHLENVTVQTHVYLTSMYVTHIQIVLVVKMTIDSNVVSTVYTVVCAGI